MPSIKHPPLKLEKGDSKLIIKKYILHPTVIVRNSIRFEIETN